MADEWDSYVVNGQPQTDEWSQYETKPLAQKIDSSIDSLIGTAVGGLAIGGVGYGLYKSGLPQKIIKGVDTVGQGLRNLPKVTDINKGDSFAKSIRGAFVQAHSDKVATFGNKIEELSSKYPKQMVSIQTAVEELNKNWSDLTPETKSVVLKTPYLKDMINKGVEGASPKLPPEIPLNKSQEIINYMNTKIPSKIRYNNLDVVETLNNIRGSQLEAFPEMEAVRAEYKQFIEPYNQVKSQFKFNKLLTSIKNKFGGAEGQSAVEKVLPKKVLKQIKGYRVASKMAELPQDIPLIGRTLKTIGGMFGYAPMALSAFRIWQTRNDPENQFSIMLGNGELPQRGSLERDIVQGRVI